MAANPAEARLRRRAIELAQQYSEGSLTLEQLRAALRTEIATAHTVAILRGTAGRRGASVDTRLAEIINAEYAEVDRLLALIADRDMSADELARRMVAFADALDDTEQIGQGLADGDDLLPLVISAGLSALLGSRTAAPTPRQSAPRLDSARLVSAQQALRDRFDTLSAQFTEGALSTDEWRAAMRQEILRAHGVYTRIGKGGALEASDLQRLNERVRRQWDYLDRWYDELARSDVRNGGQIQQRSRLYLNAANASLQEAVASSVGIPTLPAYPGDGSTSCRTNCRCTWRYQRLEGSGNWDITWQLRPAEHCDECVQRSRSWAPLQVRNGVLQPYPTAGVFR